MLGKIGINLFFIALRKIGQESRTSPTGTVGAAPMQNIVAYGIEIKEVFESLEAMDVQTGELHHFDKDACQFGYRESVFKRALKGRYIICSVTFKLNQQAHINTTYGAIQETLKPWAFKSRHQRCMEAVIKIRQSKLPDPAEIGNREAFLRIL